MFCHYKCLFRNSLLHLLIMFVGLGLVFLVTGALSQGPPPPPPPPSSQEGPKESECDLVLGGAASIANDDISESFYNLDNLKIIRPDEFTCIVTGYVTFLKDFKPNFMARIIIKKEKMGKTEAVMTYDICDFCAELRNEESPFKPELDALGFPRDCPFEAGNFEVHNLTMDTEKMPVEPVNEGNYMAEMCVYEAQDDECNEIDLQGCVTLPFTIECS